MSTTNPPLPTSDTESPNLLQSLSPEIRTIIYKQSFETDSRFPPALSATSKQIRHEVLTALSQRFHLKLTISTLWKRRVRPPPASGASTCYRIHEPFIDNASLVSRTTDQTMGTSQGICALFASSSASSDFGSSVFSYLRHVHVYIDHYPGVRLLHAYLAFSPDAPPIIEMTRQGSTQTFPYQWDVVSPLECALLGPFHIWKCECERSGKPQVFGMGLWEVLCKPIHDFQKTKEAPGTEILSGSRAFGRPISSIAGNSFPPANQ